MIWLNRINLFNGKDFNFEERKRVMQRREVTDAYKKNTIYTQKINSFLQMVEQLLSGNKDKELNTEHLLSLFEGKLNDGVEQLTQEINKPISPSRTFNETQSTKSQFANEESNSFEIDRLNLSVRDTFVFRGTSNQYGEKLEVTSFEKTYNTAVTKYAQHMQMVKNGFTVNQAKYSLSA